MTELAAGKREKNKRKKKKRKRTRVRAEADLQRFGGSLCTRRLGVAAYHLVDLSLPCMICDSSQLSLDIAQQPGRISPRITEDKLFHTDAKKVTKSGKAQNTIYYIAGMFNSGNRVAGSMP